VSGVWGSWPRRSALTAGPWRVGGPGGSTLTPFWQARSAEFMPPVEGDHLPASLLSRFLGDAEEQLASFLSFLGPITGGAWMRLFGRFSRGLFSHFQSPYCWCVTSFLLDALCGLTRSIIDFALRESNHKLHLVSVATLSTPPAVFDAPSSFNHVYKHRENVRESDSRRSAP